MVRPDAADTRAEFALALTALRESAGLSVRELARRVDAPPGTLGDYFSGRHVPSASQLPILRAVLEQCGIGDEDEVQRWFAAVARARASSDRRLSRAAPPYPGLRHFDAQDTAIFCGRDELTASILRRVHELAERPGAAGGLLAVLGPSGSGKSSVLRAGVVAALRADPERTATVVTPSTHDAAAIEAALVPPTEHVPHVLVIDQLEELFTSIDDHERTEVLEVLAARATDTPVVLGLRADFYAAAAGEPTLFPALAHAPVLVPPLAAADLRAAIVEPARRSGMTVEPGLVDLISSELAPRGQSGFAHDSGTLPLLSHALLGTWDRAEHSRLTVAAYRSAGGIAGAVQLSAEQCWAELSGAQRKTARALFLRLVHVDENAAPTRRRVGRDEFDETGSDATVVLDAFVQARLLTVDAASVQISHEALLSAWPRLRDWLEADRSGLLLHRQLTQAANVWDTGGHEAADLLRGVRLAEARAWAAAPEHEGRINAREQDFLRAAQAAEQAERRQARRRSRRQRTLLAAVAVLAVVASGLGAYALKARSDEASQRTVAAGDQNRLISKQVASNAQTLAKSDPALAEQLALVSYQIEHTDDARTEVISASGRPPVGRLLGPAGYTPLAVGAGPAGPPTGGSSGRSTASLIAVGHADDGSVHLYTLTASGQPTAVGVIRGDRPSAASATSKTVGPVQALCFGNGGRLLVVAGPDAGGADTGAGVPATIYDVATPRHPVLVDRFATGLRNVTTAAFAPDGNTLVLGGTGSYPLTQWQLAAGGRPVRTAPPQGLPPAASARSIAFSADGRELAVGASDNNVRVWPVSGATHPASDAPLVGTPAAQVVEQAGGGSVDAVAIDPTGDRLVTGTAAGTLTEWDGVGTGRLNVLHVEHDPARGRITVLAFSPDGRELGVGGADDIVHQWDVPTWTELPRVPNPEVITGLGYASERTMVSTDADGTLRSWPMQAPSINADGPVDDLDFEGAEVLVVTHGDPAGVRLWNVADPTRPTPAGPLVPVSPVDPHAAAVGALRPGGAVFATGDGTGRVRLWDASRPSSPRPLGPAWTAVDAASESMAFSPDGRRLAVGGDNGETAVWDVHDAAHPRRLTADPPGGGSPILCVRFSPDGRLLAAASTDDTVHLWDVHGGQRPVALASLGGFNGSVFGVAFSPDSTELAATAGDRYTRLFRVSTSSRGTRIGKLMMGPNGFPSTPSFSANGRLLAVPSSQHSVWVYDVSKPDSAGTIAVLRVTDQDEYAAAFDQQNLTLASGGSAAATPLWNVDDAHDVRQLCAIVGSPITRQEWARHVPSGVPYRPPCR